LLLLVREMLEKNHPDLYEAFRAFIGFKGEDPFGNYCFYFSSVIFFFFFSSSTHLPGQEPQCLTHRKHRRRNTNCTFALLVVFLLLNADLLSLSSLWHKDLNLISKLK
jgi:hypothetical protein